MNQIKLKNLISEQKCVIPLYFLKMCQGLNLSTPEMILLIYLYDKNNMVFDPNKISNDLSMDVVNVMENISSLEDKGLVRVNTIKNDKGIMEEVYDLTLLIDKITMQVISDLNTDSSSELNIHNIIEREFNRKLTPLEHDVIDDWENNNIDKELIREAVKEASINGVSNLRYIDKILVEWTKKGYKKPNDIKREKESIEESIEVFNCDWLNEDEEI